MNTRPTPASRLERLRSDTRLWGAPSACLPQRFAHVSCSACADECPVDVLSISAAGFHVAPGCLDCGRCAAACPTHALSLGGFSLETPDHTERTLSIDCERVPETLSEPGTLRVPCTGALATSQFLSLAEASGGHGAEIIDRGWCGRCTAGGSGRSHPGQSRIDEANALLAAMGTPDSARIAVREQGLPFELCQKVPADRSTRRTVDRRDFLRQLVGQSVAALQPGDTPETLGEASPPDGRNRILPAERLSVIAALRRIGEHRARPLPRLLFHEVSIGDACCNQQVCAKACPVAALVTYEDGNACGITLNPLLCIGCGACARSCPEGAVRVAIAATNDEAGETHVLTRHCSESCFDCGATFVGHFPTSGEDAPVCPSCRKSRELGRSLFSGLFQ